METGKPKYRSSPKTGKNPDLQISLERIREKAVELGATDARVIPANYVVVDERVRMKCLVPRCRGLEQGGTPHCPPNTPEPEFMRKLIDRYQWAIVFKRTFENVQNYVPTSEAGAAELQPRLKATGGIHDKTYEIVGRLESFAQGEGYYLAVGLSGGSCRTALCHGAVCGVVEKGNCRFPLQARPSMEAVGIDVFDLATKIGWDIYMIRKIEPDLSDIPCASSIGIVFVC